MRPERIRYLSCDLLRRTIVRHALLRCVGGASPWNRGHAGASAIQRSEVAVALRRSVRGGHGVVVGCLVQVVDNG